MVEAKSCNNCTKPGTSSIVSLRQDVWMSEPKHLDGGSLYTGRAISNAKKVQNKGTLQGEVIHIRRWKKFIREHTLLRTISLDDLQQYVDERLTRTYGPPTIGLILFLATIIEPFMDFEKIFPVK